MSVAEVLSLSRQMLATMHISFSISQEVANGLHVGHSRRQTR